jgi:hypothetical protein
MNLSSDRWPILKIALVFLLPAEFRYQIFILCSISYAKGRKMI